MLKQDLQLAGAFAAVLEGGIRNIPGGELAPYDAEGWCLELDPGTAHVVRLQEGVEPLGGWRMGREHQRNRGILRVDRLQGLQHDRQTPGS